jgi:hypothetical protein
MTAAILTLTTPQPQDGTRYVRGYLPFAPLRYSPRQPRYVGSTNDASHAVKHGSASQLRKTESGQSVLVPLYFIAALLTLSSGICLGQNDGIPRYKLPLVQELREARKAQQEFTAESREWRGIFKQFDGTRLKNLADRIGTLTWLVFWVLMVGISAWGLKQLASVAEAIGKVVTAWRGKA